MESTASREYRFRNFRVIPDQGQVLRGTEPVALKPKAVVLLIVLIDRRDRVVTKDELMELVWPGVTVEENNIAYTVSMIRKALGDDVVKTVPKIGYRFGASLDEEPLRAVATTNLSVRDRPLLGRASDLGSGLNRGPPSDGRGEEYGG